MSAFEPSDYVPSTDPAVLSGLLLDREGNLSQVAIAAEKQGRHLDAMYAALDVRVVEVVRCPDSTDVWLDEEGAINGSERNDALTATLAVLNRGVSQNYYGPALFLSVDEQTGETLSLSEAQVARIVTARELARFVYGV